MVNLKVGSLQIRRWYERKRGMELATGKKDWLLFLAGSLRIEKRERGEW